MKILHFTESPRKCGFRHPGLYLMGLDGPRGGCPRLDSWVFDACPCCGGGIRQSRGWTSIQMSSLFNPRLSPPPCPDHVGRCPVCDPEAVVGDKTSGLIWVGKRDYSPGEFLDEALRVGISRRIPAVPNDLVFGETWVVVGHPEAGVDAQGNHVAGPIAVFRPTHLDLVVDPAGSVSEALANRVARLVERFGEERVRVVAVTPAQEEELVLQS